MIHYRNKLLFFFLSLFLVVPLYPKILKIVAQSSRRDIFGINIQKLYKKWGAPIYLQLAFVKKESDF